MRRATDTTVVLRPVITPDEARRARAWHVRVATWIDEVWNDEPGTLPPLRGDACPPCPAGPWARRANWSGSLLCVLALFRRAGRMCVCLDAGPLILRARLVGADALEQVLAVPGLPMPGVHVAAVVTQVNATRCTCGAARCWSRAWVTPLVQATVHHVNLVRPRGCLGCSGVRGAAAGAERWPSASAGKDTEAVR